MKARTNDRHDSSPSLRKWRVGVISTDYDLQATRKALLNDLHGLGFATIAFEQPDFPVQPHLHSHAACVRAVAAMDIVVLVLDRRYGGLYLGTGTTSVTETEFWSAYRRKAILIPCVSRKLFNDRYDCKQRVQTLMTEKGFSEEQAKLEVTPTYADGWGLLEFLERIQHAGRDQFLVFYENTAELVAGVRDRLAAMTPHFCISLVSRQLAWVDSQRSTSGLFESLGHIGTTHLYKHPPSRVISGGTRRRTANSLLAEVADGPGSVLLTGAPGGGKTVELVRAFKRHAKKALLADDFRIPFYVPLKGKGLWYHFDFARYIEEAFAEFLGRHPYPCFDPRHVEPVFYVDGLDEGPVIPTIEQVESASRSPMLRSPVAMTARSAFARQVVDRCNSFASGIATHVELLNWTREHSADFAVQYLKARDKQDDIRPVQDYISRLPESHPVLTSPLILSLLLWLVDAEGATAVCDCEMGLGMLFEFFLQTWASRELRRLMRSPEQCLEAESALLLDLWEAAAWSVFRTREEGVNLPISDLTQQAVSAMGNTENLSRLASSPAFRELFRFSHRGSIVTGMIHDQFMEYLLARWFARRCINGGRDLGSYLRFPLNVDVNRFVKAIWAGLTQAQLNMTLQTLQTIAREAEKDDERTAMIVNANCVYYISRAPLPESARLALRQLCEGENRCYCKNGILFALLRLGDWTAERQLHESLSTDADADILNRGLHLEYFKDAAPGSLGSPAKDNGLLDWERCLIGLLAHLEDSTERFILSRRIDLFTIRSFVVNRGDLGPLTPERLHRLQVAALTGDTGARMPPDVAAGVAAELNSLLKTTRRLRYPA